MNRINVIGGTKERRDITEKVVWWYLKKALPRFYTLEINVELTNCYKKEKAMGYCVLGDHKKEYEIEVDKNLRLFDFVTTLCHELIHLKQYVRNELVDLNCRHIKWKGKKFRAHDYDNAPWEKEANKLEVRLAKECFEDVL